MEEHPHEKYTSFDGEALRYQRIKRQEENCPITETHTHGEESEWQKVLQPSVLQLNNSSDIFTSGQKRRAAD